jgi:hypothetical protein
LGEDSHGNEVGGVGFNDGFKAGVEMTEDWGGAEGFFEVIEDLLVLRGPRERCIFSEEVIQEVAFS